MTKQKAGRVLSSSAGEVLGNGGVKDRFLIDAQETSARFAAVQHIFEPRALAAPMHRHREEDEFTFVLSGHIGASLGGKESVVGPGDLIFKPRDEWHTFWNAGDSPAVVLELISPAGLEELFRSLDGLDELDPEVLSRMAAAFGCDIDLDATMPLIERHHLTF